MPLLIPQVSTVGFNETSLAAVYPNLLLLSEQVGSVKQVFIIRTLWNDVLVTGLENACTHELKRNNMRVSQLCVLGLSELPFICKNAAESGSASAVIAIGVMIKGETTSAEITFQSVSNALSLINTTSKCPVINGLIYSDNEDQAKARCGLMADKEGFGKHIALAALTSIAAHRKLSL